MMTHKFLAKSGVGPISGFAWPVPVGAAPGAWVEVEGAVAPCTRGVHVCRVPDLAHWIHDELWAVEVDGAFAEGVDCLVVARARLVRKVDAWSGEGSLAFARGCVEHAAARTDPRVPTEVRELLEDARSMIQDGYVAIAAFTAALAVSRMAERPHGEAAYRAEREWQSAWIADHLL